MRLNHAEFRQPALNVARAEWKREDNSLLVLRSGV